jgi:acyl carrier protein
MKVSIEEFIQVLEQEFDQLKPGSILPETVIESVIEMSSINALIFLALIKTEFDIALTAGDLLNAKTVQDLYDVVLFKSE